MSTPPLSRLNPCPWCKSCKIATVPRMRRFQAYCMQCGACGPEGQTIDEARSLWDAPDLSEERSKVLNR